MGRSIANASLGIDSHVGEDADVRLNSTFRKIAQSFAAEFDELTTEISHNLSSGEAREAVLRSLLIKYLPTRIGIEPGFVIDTSGSESKK
ncbi:MAG TPA: DUF6602 domain-containing protein, partial [Terriglobia bacterium]|nr:DUF6602 domain-containing protein [Terriglobia bacterium]